VGKPVHHVGWCKKKNGYGMKILVMKSPERRPFGKL
jgi:hypothetical protein